GTSPGGIGRRVDAHAPEKRSRNRTTIRQHMFHTESLKTSAEYIGDTISAGGCKTLGATSRTVRHESIPSDPVRVRENVSTFRRDRGLFADLPRDART